MNIICPESTCRAENDVRTETCVRCQTPLRAYAQLLIHPARLFNRGLVHAREKQFAQARDFFAAVVHWCPMDLEARNALAMACFATNDPMQAYQQWKQVLAVSPADPLATQGLAALQSRFSQPQAPGEKEKQPKKPGNPKRKKV